MYIKNKQNMEIFHSTNYYSKQNKLLFYYRLKIKNFTTSC